MGDSATKFWETLTQACERAEREDPAVAKAAADFDEAVDRLNEKIALHKFRPLPWDPE